MGVCRKNSSVRVISSSYGPNAAPASRMKSGTGRKRSCGYLNFSRGEANPEFQRGINDLCRTLEPGWQPNELRDSLLAASEKAPAQNPAFSDVGQANAVIELTLDHLLPAYRAFHRDLLFHLSDADFAQPFLITRMFEAVLSQGPSWDQTQTRPRALALKGGASHSGARLLTGRAVYRIFRDWLRVLAAWS